MDGDLYYLKLHSGEIGGAYAVFDKRGTRVGLVVSRFENRPHLSVVELRRAA